MAKYSARLVTGSEGGGGGGGENWWPPTESKPGESSTAVTVVPEAPVAAPAAAVISDSGIGLYVASGLAENGITLDSLLLGASLKVLAKPGIEEMLRSLKLGVRLFRGFVELAELMAGMVAAQIHNKTHRDLYFVVASFGEKIPPHIVEAHVGRLLNIHPSKLPEYAGVADPITEMLKDNRKDGWVSVHYVTNELDRGTVLGQRQFPLLYDGVYSLTESNLTRNVPVAFRTGAALCADVLKHLPSDAGTK